MIRKIVNYITYPIRLLIWCIRMLGVIIEEVYYEKILPHFNKNI